MVETLPGDEEMKITLCSLPNLLDKAENLGHENK